MCSRLSAGASGCSHSIVIDEGAFAPAFNHGERAGTDANAPGADGWYRCIGGPDRPLWAADRPPVSSLHRAVRARVTSNGFRELDVLLAHWVGLMNGRPVRMDDADGWREGGAHEYPFDAVFTPSDIMRIAADYRLAALPSAIADRELAA